MLSSSRHRNTAALAGAAGAVTALSAIYLWRKQQSKSTPPANIHLGDPQDATTVLKFWFEGEVKELFISRWFPDPGSERQQATDQAVRERFGSLLRAAENNQLQEWSSRPTSMLALILVLDQFSRHFYRDVPNGVTRIKQNDEKALKLTYLLLERGWDKGLAAPQFCFALMPLRHSPTPERLQLVLAKIQGLLDLQPAHDELVKKFRRATLRRLQDLEGKAETATDDFDILEFAPFDADTSDMHTHPLVHSMRQFLASYNTHETAVVSLSGGVDSMVVARILVYLRDNAQVKTPPQPPRPMRNKKEFRKQTANNENNDDEAAPQDAQHSLQDSDANNLSRRGGANRGKKSSQTQSNKETNPEAKVPQKIVAIHIDYGNRPESGAEADFVEEWCAKHSIVFHKRHIHEVTRGITKRAEYEIVSRNIRYETYTQVLSQLGCNAVLFGHHQGDLQENVISNSVKGGGILDLAGMHPTSVVNGVTIWRPFLKHVKADIFAFAHKYGVPYFKDTTPRWSTRGKMRNQLLPLMEDMFGDGFLRNLSLLAEESTQLNELVQEMIFRPFFSAVHSSPAATWVDCGPFLSHPPFFWKEVFKHMCHNLLGEPMIREKPMGELLERLARPQKLNGWITLKKTGQSYVHGTTVVLFHPTFIPTEPDTERVDIAVTFGQEIQVGLWTVLVKPLEGGLESNDQLPTEVDMWHVVTGKVKYALQNKPPLVVIAKNKHLRVARGMDKQIKDAVPFVAGLGKQQDTSCPVVVVELTFHRPISHQALPAQ